MLDAESHPLSHPWRLEKHWASNSGRQRVGAPRSEPVCVRGRFSVAIMLDTEGSEVHTSALDQPIKAEVGHPRALPVAPGRRSPVRWTRVAERAA